MSHIYFDKWMSFDSFHGVCLKGILCDVFLFTLEQIIVTLLSISHSLALTQMVRILSTACSIKSEMIMKKMFLDTDNLGQTRTCSYYNNINIY